MTATSTTRTRREVPETAAVNVRNRSFTIAAEVDVQTPEASGVLFSHGARFGGHALYVKDRTLRYVYNFVGDKEQMVDLRRDAIPIGARVLSAVFEREGTSMPTTGTLSLYVNDDKVGEGQIMTQPGNFSLVGEGLNIGKDAGEPVTRRLSGLAARTASPAGPSVRSSSTSRASRTSTSRKRPSL